VQVEVKPQTWILPVPTLVLYLQQRVPLEVRLPDLHQLFFDNLNTSRNNGIRSCLSPLQRAGAGQEGWQG
jgi:hypothetical protein